VPVFQLRQRPGQNLFFTLSRILRHERIDVIHSNNWGTFLDTVIAGQLARTPLIVHCIHGLFTDDLERMKFHRRLLQRLLSLGTGRLYAVADFLRDYYIRVVGVPASRITTIYNGVDTDIFRDRGDQERRENKARLGFPPDQVLVGSVGTLYWVKDPDLFLTAASLVLRQRDDVRFLWVGGGPLQEQMAGRTQSLGLQGKVVYLGTRDDIPAILSALDIFVLPSVIEGLSYSILEAMASGLPAVATRVGGNPELVRDAQDGYLVAAQRPDHLAEVLLALAGDKPLRQRLGGNARRRVVETFSLKKMVESYQTMYLMGLGRSREPEALPTPSIGGVR